MGQTFSRVQSFLYSIHLGVGVPDMHESRKHAIAKADEALLAELGYKQEFKRAFTPLEVGICIAPL